MIIPKEKDNESDYPIVDQLGNRQFTNQQSIEEAAEAYATKETQYSSMHYEHSCFKRGFVAGAKSQAAEIERLRMQLTACGVASMSNTEKSMKEQTIDGSNPYWSPSYEQVCDAVKREIALRKELEQFKQQKP